MRTSRIRTTALAVAAAAVALGGLTACGGADGGADAASKAAGGAGATAGARSDSAHGGSAQSRAASTGGGEAGAKQVDAGGVGREGARSTVAASGDTDEAGGKGAAVGARACRGDEMLVTAVHRFAGQQGDHLLLTASNTGGKPCWVTSYPSVKLGDVEGAALPHSKKDAPGGDKRITLPSGGRVYSAVNLFDYGSNNNHTAKSFAMALRGADGQEGPFYSVDVKGGQPQFRWTEADVLNWNTKKPYDF